MSNQKPSLPKGTRDFGPIQMARRNYIFDTIKKTFKLFGYEQIETPAMENLSVLTGKYGDEGDQLLFKILNSGDFMSKADSSDLNSNTLLPQIAEKGLRYDLTVPFARYVVMNRHEINFPFKRFQIQPVWRADRPQKGRYREFYQCDADVVGTDSLLCEAEIVLMINRVFADLMITDYSIKINNRKILSGIAETIGAPGQEGPLCVAIDKLDKIGQEKVNEELIQRGFSTSSVEKLAPIYDLKGDKETVINSLKTYLQDSEIGLKGLEELEEVFQLVKDFGLSEDHIAFEPTLARGLSYYTGAIFEVKVAHVSIGSVSGGGRYDNLTGVFGMEGVSGVGFSFGVDRIYDVMDELALFQNIQLEGTQVLITTFDEPSYRYGLQVLATLRGAGIAAELFPEAGAKMKKQMNYGDKKQIPFVCIIGSEEVAQQKLTFKNMSTGEQQLLTPTEIIRMLT
ncbi:histidine--tRNA ligase [Penaeicola halotolerans]|uniref:histidine--tRNA ligase n=1 Tax=Penaeicola halotolerans TaxID=2793196 RepID=UPI001CF8E4D5|nr:histidine--tRNA ligase [Penaeicola halotolerans]